VALAYLTNNLYRNISMKLLPLSEIKRILDCKQVTDKRKIKILKDQMSERQGIYTKEIVVLIQWLKNYRE